MHLLVAAFLQVLVNGIPNKVGARCFLVHMVFQSRFLLLPFFFSLYLPIAQHCSIISAQRQKSKVQVEGEGGAARFFLQLKVFDRRCARLSNDGLRKCCSPAAERHEDRNTFPIFL